jgi:XRE family aerobic/anaerobic benzoate catabolism transcriptional regulator
MLAQDTTAAAARDPLLQALARRVRALREARGWTRSQLAAASGLSVRFLARIEGGEGNVSILRLYALARALDTTADALLRADTARSDIVVLVGMRGAGKSTVGPRLAEQLDVPFVELEALITEAAGLPLDQLFELHGEEYYRRLERERLLETLERDESCVVAAAGGVVNDPGTWELLCRRTTVVWLRATPEDHWGRVIAQGDRRPMADNPRAMDQLRTLLRTREPIYSRARMTVETSERTPSEVVAELVERVALLRSNNGEPR